MVTIRDVAERANVSLGTVSRVLNGHPAVRPVAREAVGRAIAELGYVPNPAAQSLRRMKSHALGLVIPDLLSPMTVTLTRAVEDVAGRAGYTVFVADSRLDEGLEASHIARLLERRVDGLLVSPVQPIAAVERCVSKMGRVPTVLVQLRKPVREFPTAFVDEQPAVYECAEHLVSLGHRRVAVLHSGSRAGGGRFRRDLIRGALAERGITGGGDLDRSFAETGECYAAAMAALNGPERATAILVGVHKFVPPVLRAIRDANLRIPDDVSVVSFGDSDWAESISPPLNVVVVDQAAHAEGAMALLLKAISGEPLRERHFRSESIYVRRGSVGPAGGCVND
ncbi:MAG: LacI family DNA-binding transcriptional regulator [Dehalococcoidia bacterium]|nr:LacI family DNA-binding transcriptional regulator [Dehalococcoidia bacterium]